MGMTTELPVMGTVPRRAVKGRHDWRRESVCVLEDVDVEVRVHHVCVLLVDGFDRILDVLVLDGTSVGRREL
jgi:hypothetical protein